MHDGTNPIFHRDIRWDNIVRRADDESKWFIIDWDDAAERPTSAATHLNPSNHAPSVFHDGHAGEVDVWGVGELIREASRFVVSFPSSLLRLGEAMKGGELDAEAALGKVKEFRGQFLPVEEV
jgi:hypothetical protein